MRRLLHVDEPAVRARAEEHDVDRLTDRGRHVDDLVDARRHRDLRLERRKVDRHLAQIARVVIGAQPGRRLRRPDDDPRLRAHLGRHARQGDAVALRKIAHAVELDARVTRAISADLANDAHDRVLHRDALAQAACEVDLDGLGHAEPGPPESECNSDVRRAHASAERADRTVRIRVRVAADDDRAGLAVALLDHDLMADALAGVVEGRDLLLAHPLAQHAMRISNDRRRRGCGVVDEDADL